MSEHFQEYVSHFYPKVARVQYEACFSFVAGFTYSTSNIEPDGKCIWTLVDEAISQNARWHRPKPTSLYMLEFAPSGRLTCFQLRPSNQKELWKVRTYSTPKRLIGLACKLAARDNFHADPEREGQP
jgi:hypothetical protein